MSKKAKVEEPMSSSDVRAEIEARRGIVRDENGKIIRSKEWVKERIATLKAKRKDLENRIVNIDAEIAERSA